MAVTKCNTARNVYLTSTFFMILAIMSSTSPSCQGREQPLASGQPPHKPPILPHPPSPPVPPTPTPHPPGPPVPPTPTPHPPSPPLPPTPTPPPTPGHPPQPPPHGLLQAEHPQVARNDPPQKPQPPVPVPWVPVPRPPPIPHRVLQAEPKSETCYPNINQLSLIGCEQMCKENGFETKHSYYIERQDAKWECCCPH